MNDALKKIAKKAQGLGLYLSVSFDAYSKGNQESAFYLAGKIPSDISIKLDYLVNNDPEDKGLRSEDYTESKLIYKDLRTVLAEVKKYQEKTAC